MRLYDLNTNFLSTLFERIQLAAKNGIVFWNDVPGGEFNRNVLAMAFPTISRDVFRKIIEETFKASLETEEGEFGRFSVLLEPPNPDEFRYHYKFARDLEFSAGNLVKLSKALNSDLHGIGVWFAPADRALTGTENDLVIWGFKSRPLRFCTINFVAPGKISLNFCLTPKLLLDASLVWTVSASSILSLNVRIQLDTG